MMIPISEFIQEVAKQGFTRACVHYNINGVMLRNMFYEVQDYDKNILPAFATKQQIVYNYIATVLKKKNL